MEFAHVQIDDSPPCGRLGFCCTPDLTGNGRPDIVIGGMGREGVVTVAGKRLVLSRMPVVKDLLRRRESNVIWYENPGWERHEVVSHPDLSVGATVADIDGDGSPELIVGENNGSSLYWFDPPADPRNPWKQHRITDAFEKYHDTAVGDVDGDGDEELVILSQGSRVVCYYDIPDDPRVSPWPRDHRHEIASDLLVEGVAIADIDRNGIPELVAGPNIFRKNGQGWVREKIDGDWQWTRLIVVDINNDGQDEIILSEGDLPYQGDRNGRVGIVDSQTLEVRILDDDLYCPHTLDCADTTGSGRQDILVAEMGLTENKDPRMFLYRNEGDGSFDRQTIHTGTPTHEAKFTDLTGNGHPDIVGKPYGPSRHVDIWYNQTHQ